MWPRLTLALRLWLPALAVCVGCSNPAPEERSYSPPRVVPVSGVVTLNGKPIAKAVLTFLPAHGGTGVGETDSNGKYELKSNGGLNGVPPDEYKVAISYLVSSDGVPQGVGPRSAMVQSPGMLSAKEQLPRKYSDLGRSELTATVGNEGGAGFDFKLEGELVTTPQEPSSEAGPGAEKKEPSKDAEQTSR